MTFGIYPRLRALQGVRVLSVCLNLPGPAALARLRDMGAFCQKIEPLPAPDGHADPMQLFCPGLYEALHTGIEVHRADLKSSSGQTSLRELLSQTDVLLTSFRPSALARLGMDWTNLHQQFPRLCMASIVGGSGQKAEHPGHDLTYLAASGLVPDLSLPPTLYADMTGALMASEAVLQLLLKRSLAGKGGRLMVSLGDAAAHLALPRDWRLTGKNTILGGAHAGYRLYPCKNGRVAVAAIEPHFSRALCEATGLAWHGAAMMLESLTHEHFQIYFQGRTCRQIKALAAQRDIPLLVMPSPG